MKMKMKITAIVLLAALSAAGCVSVKYPDAHDKSFPPDGRYEILGPVTVREKTVNVLGIVTVGGVRYVDLYNEARKRYSANDVVNVSVDKEILSIFGIVTIIDIIIRGTAIRHIDPSGTPPEAPPPDEPAEPAE